MKQADHNFKKGFTLIELLFVISIISLLSSVILGSVNEARAKARDTRRVQDIDEVEKALHLYYSVHGQFPPQIGNGRWQALNVLVTEGFISALPKDPEQPSVVCNNNGDWISSNCRPNIYYYFTGKSQNFPACSYTADRQFYNLRFHYKTKPGNVKSELGNPGCPIANSLPGENPMIRANY